MRSPALSLAAMAAILALAACDKDSEITAPAEDGRTARGEVLGGSISDSMLPLDTVRSQSPREEKASAKNESGRNAAASAADEPAPEDAGPDPAESEPAPAASAPATAATDG